MYLRVRDEYGAIREYRQSLEPAVPGQLIKIVSNPAHDGIEQGDIVRVDFVGVNGQVIVGGQKGYSLTQEDYLVLNQTQFLWFKKVRHKEVSQPARQGDRIIAQLASGKYMILNVQRVTDSGVVGRSDDFTKFIDDGNYKVILSVSNLPLKLRPYYTVDKIPKAGQYVEIQDQLLTYDTSEYYPAIYEVAYKNDTCVSITQDMLGRELTRPLQISLDKCKVLEFTEEYADQIFTVKQIEAVEPEPEVPVKTEAEIPLEFIENMNNLEDRVELLELVFDDMFSRMTSSLYLRRREKIGRQRE
ncbi:hypothetical protein SP15_286 [Bacillus phage SP-15]|uniref:Uncharacterized protein n=1 Tax=Bacillus phage SP-15 TaxID=1792032 RepID=A0A127AY32_9CAUD|nr:hypothetical protein SP15_286 [Bacillus phage SP-15]AMM45094.1 hypothetical protein SP15_286 [Bacillus phage SP-15]